MMEHYAKNMAFLQQKAPVIYKKIKQEQTLFPDVILHAEGENIKACHGSVKCYLKSRYDVQKEYEWLCRGWSEDTDFIIIFGASLFNMVAYLIKRFKKLRKIIFVEPVLQIFDNFLQYNDFAAVFAETRGIQVVFTINFPERTAANDIMGLFWGTQKLNVAVSLPYQSLIEEYYKKFMEELSATIVNLGMNFLNDRVNQNLWTRETMQNLFFQAFPVEKLKPVFHGKPVILVGAGPSLNKNIELLRAAREKAIIIACGKAVQVLNQAGIKPHFNAGLDVTNCDYYDNLRYTDVPLIFANQFSSEILRRYPGEKFQMTLTADPITRYLYSKAKKREFTIAVGTSIINSMHDMAACFGASAVIFVGQDMCFFENKMYAGSQNTEIIFSNLEKRKDIYGNVVYTTPTYYSIQWVIERDIARYPEIPVINATEGGLGMQGAKNTDLAVVLGNLCILSSIEQEIKAVMKRRDEKFSSAECWEQIDMTKQISEIIYLVEDTLKHIGILAEMYKNNEPQNRLVKQMDKIKQKERKMNKHVLYYTVIHPLLGGIFAVMNGYEAREIDPFDDRVKGFMKRNMGIMTEARQCCLYIQEQYQEIANQMQIAVREG